MILAVIYQLMIEKWSKMYLYLLFFCACDKHYDKVIHRRKVLFGLMFQRSENPPWQQAANITTGTEAENDKRN